MFHYLISPHSHPLSYFHWCKLNRPTNLQLQHYLFTYGPLAVAISTNCLQSVSPALFQHESKEDSLLDHAVLLIGYEVDAHQKQYWICKNSWGKTWGLFGFFGIYFEKHQITCFEEGMGIRSIPPCYHETYTSLISFSTENPHIHLHFESKPLSHSDLRWDRMKGYQSHSLLSQKPIPLPSVVSFQPPPLTLNYSNSNNPKKFGIVGEVLDQGSRPLAWLFASVQMVTSVLAFHFSVRQDQFIQASIQMILQQLLHFPEPCILYQQQGVQMKCVFDLVQLKHTGSCFQSVPAILHGQISTPRVYLNGNKKKGLGLFPYEYCAYDDSIPLFDPQMCEFYIFPSSEQSFPVPVHMNYIDMNQITYWSISIFLTLLFFCLIVFLFLLYRSTTTHTKIRS